MTDPRETLARIRERAAAATEGPWEAKGGFVEPSREDLPTVVECSDPEVHDVDNAAFIAAARTDVPWLLEQVGIRDKALEAVLELHKPIQASMTSRDGVSDVTVCDHCFDPTWPCPTVAAITTPLEEDHA